MRRSLFFCLRRDLGVRTKTHRLVAVPVEERGLIAHFGDRNVRYRQWAGALIPRLTRRRAYRVVEMALRDSARG